MPSPPRPLPVPRARDGHTLLECLLALTVLAGSLAALMPLHLAVLVSADATAQRDLAEATADGGAAGLLRAPCAPVVPTPAWPADARHRAAQTVTGETVRILYGSDRWAPIGLGPRPSQLVRWRIGARCE